MTAPRVMGAAVALCSAVAVVAGWAGIVGTSDPFQTAQIAMFLSVVVLGSQAAGLVMLARDAGRWTGPLVQASALGALVAAAVHAETDVVEVAAALGLATVAIPALLVVDRTGTDGSAGARRILTAVRASVVGAAALAVPVVVAAHGADAASPMWWAVDDPDTVPTSAHVLMAAHSLFVAAAATGAAIIGIAAFRRSTPAERTLLRGVVATGAVWSVVTVLHAVVLHWEGPVWIDFTGGFTSWGTLVVIVLPMLATAALVVTVVWIELAVPRLRRGDAGLVLRTDPNASVTAYVRQALADPSALALFAGPDGTWVDEHGDPVPPADDPERALTTFRRDGETIGAISHDALLLEHPDALELVATAAGLALERTRRVADAAAALRSTRTLTARLVLAPDAARAELAAALAAGPDAELRAIEAAVLSGEPLDGVSDRLRAVAADVRTISHGLLPPELTDGGLADALPGATVRTTRRFPPSVEVTAYLAARDDPGAVISDDGGSVSIVLSHPPDGSTVLDRVAVLGGTVDGARIELPVGS